MKGRNCNAQKHLLYMQVMSDFVANLKHLFTANCEFGKQFLKVHDYNHSNRQDLVLHGVGNMAAE